MDEEGQNGGVERRLKNSIRDDAGHGTEQWFVRIRDEAI
jgi:hypothetical protein